MEAPSVRGRPPGFLRAAGILAAKDFRLEWRTWDALTSMALFALIVLVLFNFVFDLRTVRELGAARLVPGVFWVTLAFAGVVGFVRSFQLERRDQAEVAVRISGVGPGATFAGKTLANLVLLLVLELVLLPLSAVLFDYDLLAVAPALVLVVLLHTAGLAELGTLFGAVAVHAGRGEALLLTLLIPAAAPLLIAAVECTGAVLDGRGLAAVAHWLWVAAAFDVLFLLVGLLAFEFVLEE